MLHPGVRIFARFYIDTMQVSNAPLAYPKLASAHVLWFVLVVQSMDSVRNTVFMTDWFGDVSLGRHCSGLTFRGLSVPCPFCKCCCRVVIFCCWFCLTTFLLIVLYIYIYIYIGGGLLLDVTRSQQERQQGEGSHEVP